MDILVFTNKGTIPEKSAKHQNETGENIPHLNQETYEKARIAAPGWDVYELEKEWREWSIEPPRNPDAAFLGFCRKVAERRSGGPDLMFDEFDSV